MNRFEKQTLLSEAFDQRFNKNDLQGWIKNPVRKFVISHEKFLKEHKISPSFIDLAFLKNTTKENLAIVASIPFLTKEIFQAFQEYLPLDVRKILDALVWEKSLHQNEVKKRFGITIYETETFHYSSTYKHVRAKLKPDFKFLDMSKSHYWNSQEFTLQLLPDLRRVLVDYYPPPKGKEINPVKEIPKTDFLYTSGEQDIFLEFPRLLAYVLQDQVKVTTKGKPQASTLGKMQRKLNLKEFYEDTSEKELKTVRSNLLAGLIGHLKHRRAQKEMDVPILIKMLFQTFYREHYNSLLCILTHLKGGGHIDTWQYRKVEKVFLQILESLPTNEWVSMENIEAHIKYNLLPVEVVGPVTAEDKLYYTYERDREDRHYYFGNKHHVSGGRYYPSVVLPMIQGALYLFAAFGLLDVAYDEIDASVMGKTCQSPYDGLRYIRLTKLGAYVSGQITKYEVPKSISHSSISLSADSLTIIVDKNDMTADILLEPYSVKVSPNRYRTDYTFFLKDCRSKKELNDKIKLFKQTIAQDLPANWEAFFKELESKINPFEPTSDIKIYKIPSDNQGLIRLIARDAVLKNLCMKAEGYYILVEKSKVARFKKRLQEFGYLLT